MRWPNFGFKAEKGKKFLSRNAFLGLFPIVEGGKNMNTNNYILKFGDEDDDFDDEE